MRKHFALTGILPNIAPLDDEEPDDFAFAHWSAETTLEWLAGEEERAHAAARTVGALTSVVVEGIDDVVAAYQHLLPKHDIDGSTLGALTDERLRRIGVLKEAARRLILQACQLLVYYVSESCALEHLRQPCSRHTIVAARTRRRSR